MSRTRTTKTTTIEMMVLEMAAVDSWPCGAGGGLAAPGVPAVGFTVRVVVRLPEVAVKATCTPNIATAGVYFVIDKGVVGI